MPTIYNAIFEISNLSNDFVYEFMDLIPKVWRVVLYGNLFKGIYKLANFAPLALVYIIIYDN